MTAATKNNDVAAMDAHIIDARIEAYITATNQAVVLHKTIERTEREDDGAPWAGLAADIRRLP